MNRAHLQQLALERIRDAAALLNAGQWSGAYYLAGYAVECALKACIAKMTNQFDFPDKERAVKCYTHNIEELVRLAGLRSARDGDSKSNPLLEANWFIASDWDEQSRYELWAEIDSRKLFNAVTDPTNGVMPWIMVRW